MVLIKNIVNITCSHAVKPTRFDASFYTYYIYGQHLLHLWWARLLHLLLNFITFKVSNLLHL